jgi:hypothetical protein
MDNTDPITSPLRQSKNTAGVLVGSPGSSGSPTYLLVPPREPVGGVKAFHHHQPINVPTAGAQAFLMDYPQGERAITHHAGPV